MTTRDQARRAITRRSEGDRRGGSTELDDARPRLPDRLAAARETKGVDLYRAERDTKIRARYLAALERGDYAALPGTVYTKGFLRNYALYLGLDADDVLEQWRHERGAGAEQRPVPVVPRSVTIPRQGITLSFGMLGLVLLLVVAGSVAYFLGSRIFTALQPSVISVDHPSGAVETVAGGTATYLFSGTAAPGATIIMTADGSELPAFTADATSGRWQFDYHGLHLGVNVFQFKATDPGTLKSSDTAEVKIIVPTPAASASPGPGITITSPANGASFQTGTVPISGTTTGTGITVAATYLGPGTPIAPTTSPNPIASPARTPAPTPAPTAAPKATAAAKPGGSPAPTATPLVAPSGAPGPVTLPVASDGSFSTSLQLPAGRWDLAFTSTDGKGGQQTVHRLVNVPPKGVTAVLRFKGGSAWIKIAKDGVVDKSLTRIYQNGETLTVTANSYIDIRTGIAAYTYITVNGVDYGQIGTQARSGSWRLYPTGRPQPSTFS